MIPAGLSRSDLERIYDEAKKAGRVPVATGLDFAHAKLKAFDFRSRFSDGSGFSAQLLGTYFYEADLEGAVLAKTDWVGADLDRANLANADMRAGNFYSTRFWESNLAAADLRLANLHSALIIGAQVSGANFAGARMGNTVLSDIDLSGAVALEEVLHIAPSSVGIDTLRRTASGLRDADDQHVRDIVTFLTNAGVEDTIIDVFRSWIGKPIRYHSTFLSHSSLDKAFARRLYHDLRAMGVNCWFDEKQLVPGDVLIDEIDRAVRLWDKVILVCSKHSLDTKTGWWVEQEVERALKKERELRKISGDRHSVLIPVTIDDYLFTCEGPLHATITQRHVGDFREWRSPQSYAAALDRLIGAVRADRRSA